MAEKRFTVGQTVLVLPTYGRGGRSELEPLCEATVTKVGRTRVYIKQYGREIPYRMEDGYPSLEDPAQTRIMTPEAWDTAVKRRALLDRLDTPRFPWYQLTLEQLEAIAKIVGR